MTSISTFVWDATGPLYAGAADRLDALVEAAGVDRQQVVPRVVLSELERHQIADVDRYFTIEDNEFEDSIEDLHYFNKLLQALGGDVTSGYDLGEVYVVYSSRRYKNSVAIIDDARARRVLRKNFSQVNAKGVLWAISQGVIEGRVEGPEAYRGLCDSLLRAKVPEGGALRWPFELGGYAEWFWSNEEKLREQ